MCFFKTLSVLNPEPKGELEYVNIYTLLVAVVLSAQATDKGVNKATGPLFKKVTTPQQMVALGEDTLRTALKTIGLYRTKAANVIALSQQLIQKYGGNVPQNREALESLPGVGRKTANVVLNIGFGEPTLAVDTHVFRVGNRTGLAPGATPAKVEEAFLRIIPPAYARHAHHWLILHGRYICTARAPKCGQCPVRPICRWPEKTA